MDKAAGKGDHKPAVDFEDVLDDGGEGKERVKFAGGRSGGAASGSRGGGVVTLQRFSVTGIPEGKMFQYKSGQVVQPDFPLWRPPSKRSDTDSSTTRPWTPKLSGTIELWSRETGGGGSRQPLIKQHLADFEKKFPGTQTKVQFMVFRSRTRRCRPRSPPGLRPRSASRGPT
jgi:hypothetical protein